MTLLLVFGLTLLAIASVLGVRALALPQLRAQARIEEIASYTRVPERRTIDPDGGRTSALQRVAWALGSAVSRRVTRIDLDAIRRQLLRAGHYRSAPETLVGYSVFSAIALGLLLTAAAPAGALGVLFPVIGVLIGAVGPYRILHIKADKRAEKIDDRLPELIDLLVVTVEAGLSFTASIGVAAKRIEGPLRDELRLALQEQRMGLPITDALRNMLERVETPSMRSFVRSIVQGETLGVSIGTIMRNLADEMRKRRRGRAEERAHKAPVKMLFPLVFLMFPAIFVVLLGPAMMNIIESFGSMK